MCVTGTRNVLHIWTHPALQGQCLLMAAKGTTARIYPASLSKRLCPRRALGCLTGIASVRSRTASLGGSYQATCGITSGQKGEAVAA